MFIEILAFAAFFVAAWLIGLTIEPPPAEVAQLRHYRLMVFGIRMGFAAAATFFLWLVWMVVGSGVH